MMHDNKQSGAAAGRDVMGACLRNWLRRARLGTAAFCSCTRAPVAFPVQHHTNMLICILAALHHQHVLEFATSSMHAVGAARTSRPAPSCVCMTTRRTPHPTPRHRRTPQRPAHAMHAVVAQASSLKVGNAWDCSTMHLLRQMQERFWLLLALHRGC